jgi:hypothetical protein
VSDSRCEDRDGVEPIKAIAHIRDVSVFAGGGVSAVMNDKGRPGGSHSGSGDHRRIKARESIAMGQLTAATNEKIGAAMVALGSLQEADSHKLHGDINAREAISQFAAACRVVVQRAETYGKEHLQAAEVRQWYPRWEYGLALEERRLWDVIWAVRDSDQHGRGYEFRDVSIPLDDMHSDANLTLLGLGAQRPYSSKGGVRFPVFPDEPASSVCARALPLFERYVRDFKAYFGVQD